jgi:OOP family OmpA-OmpF porin
MNPTFNGRIVRFLGLTTCAIGLLVTTSMARAEGWYAGVGVGTFDYDIVDESDNGAKVFVGYGFHPNFGVELTYADLGEGEVKQAGVGSASVEAAGYGLSAVGILPVNPNFSVFGKVGYFSWDVDAKATLTGIFSASGDDSGSDVFYGVGAQYDFNRNFGARFEWELYDLDEFEEVTAMSISAVFKF